MLIKRIKIKILLYSPWKEDRWIVHTIYDQFMIISVERGPVVASSMLHS